MKIRQQTERVIEDDDKLLIEGVVIHGVDYTVRLLRTWPTKPENERGLRIEFWKGEYSKDQFAAPSWSIDIDTVLDRKGVFARIRRFLARPGHDHNDIQELSYPMDEDDKELKWVNHQWMWEPVLIEFGSAVRDERH